MKKFLFILLILTWVFPCFAGEKYCEHINKTVNINKEYNSYEVNKQKDEYGIGVDLKIVKAESPNAIFEATKIEYKHDLNNRNNSVYLVEDVDATGGMKLIWSGLCAFGRLLKAVIPFV